MKQKHFTHFILTGLLAFAVVLGVGCGKSPAPAPQASTQPAAPPPANDSQIAAQVQNQLHADAALGNLPIQTQAVNGVVTISGTVNDEAARELAANDAAQVAGVRTVVNNLIVQQAAVTPPSPSPAEIRAQNLRAKKEQEAQLRRQQREQARKLREQQQQEQQQAENNPPPPPPVTDAAQSQPQQAPPPPPPPPPPQPITQTITIPAGTDLAVRITDNLETGKTQTNDKFHGILADSLVINGIVAIPRRANVTGLVLDAKDAKRFKGNSELSLELQKIKTHNMTLVISTDPLVQKGSGRGKNTAEKAGGGALLGTLIGAIAGGGRGALIGAATGGAAGAGVNAVTRGQQVKIPSETVLHFQINQPLTVTVTTMPDGQPMNSNSSSSNSPQLQGPQ